MPSAEEIFRGAHEPRREPAECVGESSPLRDGGERHPRQGNANGEAGDDRDHDPGVVHDLGLDPGGQDGHDHSPNPRHHPAAGGLGIVHPVQCEDEQHRGQHGGELGDGVGHCFLNIFSMRSVIMNPLTMFVIEANSATAPRTRITRG